MYGYMPIRHDLTNQTFGNLTVIGPHRQVPYGNTGKVKTEWFCHCACGNDCWRQADALIQKQSDSCGCLAKARSLAKIHKAHEATAIANLKHGGNRSNRLRIRLYTIWAQMKGRCDNTNHISYKYYGARGITYYPAWGQYEPFEKWAEKSGYNDSLTIERIDVNQGYSPQNCTWVTQKEQMRNTRRNIRLSSGESISTFCEHHNVPSDLVWHALKLKREYPEVWPYIVND
jgi:hypothetical protein